MDELDELRDLADRHQVRVVGLHAHTGSGVLEPDSWRETGELLAGLRQRFGDVLAIINTGAFGSAMGSNYNLRAPATEVLI